MLLDLIATCNLLEVQRLLHLSKQLLTVTRKEKGRCWVSFGSMDLLVYESLGTFGSMTMNGMNWNGME